MNCEKPKTVKFNIEKEVAELEVTMRLRVEVLQDCECEECTAAWRHLSDDNFSSFDMVFWSEDEPGGIKGGEVLQPYSAFGEILFREVI